MIRITMVLDNSASVSIGKLVLVTKKKSHYYSSLPPQRLEFEALRSFKLHPSKETLFVLSLDVWVRSPCSANNNYCCSSYFTSGLHSTDPPDRGDANLIRSLRERSAFLSWSLKSGTFGDHVFVKEDVACTWKSYFLEKIDERQRSSHQACQNL